MRTLLCLLSDQHVPNLLSVHHFQPDRLLLIETAGMRAKRSAEHFLNALRLGGRDFADDRRHVERLESEDDLASIRACLQRAYERNPVDEWVVNLSGGTKPMSIAAYEFFKLHGARLVYVNAARPNALLAFDGRSTEQCSYRPTIREFLAGYGYEYQKSPADIGQAENRARGLWDCATRIAFRSPARLLNLGDLRDEPAKKRWDKAREKGITLEAGQLVTEHEDVGSALCSALQLTHEPDGLTGKLDKYAVEFVTGGWLEVFVWGLLDRHADAMKIWDVRLGVRAAKVGSPTNNDLDIAFLRDDYSLCVAECKSGDQENDPNAEVLHKVEAVIRQFGALRFQSFLATTSSNVLGNDGRLKTQVRDRSAIYRCRILTRDDIQRLAGSPNDFAVVRDTFGRGP